MFVEIKNGLSYTWIKTVKMLNIASISIQCATCSVKNASQTGTLAQELGTRTIEAKNSNLVEVEAV